MTPTILELFEKCCGDAADQLLRDGDLQFEAIFLTRDDKRIFCVADMPDSLREREALVSTLEMMASASDAVAVVVVAEVWFSHDRTSDRRPSESPNRREALKVSIMYRDVAGVSVIESVREILRDVHGKIVELRASLEPLTPVRCDRSMEHLMRILPPDRPSRRDRRLAKAVIERLLKDGTRKHACDVTVH